MLLGKIKNSGVRRVRGENFTKQRNLVGKLFEQLTQIVGDIIIEKKLHP